MSDDDSSEDFGPKDEPRASSEFAARALNRLVGEALVATPPDLDWQCIEARLLAGIEAERVAIAPKPRGSFGAAVSFIAVAAAIVLLVTSGRGPSPTAIPSPTRLIDVATLPSVEHGDGGRAQLASALGPGAAIETGAVAERLVLPGVAAFTLAPNSRVVIRAVAIPYVLELERGEVTASVVPRHDPDHVVEAFVVESGGVRVAVHGTVFSVRRSGEKIEVYVSEGVVTVGP
ncbi:MAG: hypothetical protein EXR75_05260, partial [Myxococcales bacterium]|nr:hypothetical protein [Myxococcales bacterium]